MTPFEIALVEQGLNVSFPKALALLVQLQTRDNAIAILSDVYRVDVSVLRTLITS